METFVLLVAGCVVAAVVVRARRSTGRDGRTTLFARREPARGLVPLVCDVPHLEAHVLLDTLRSEGIRAELAVARSRPSIVATIGMPTDFDVFVHPRDEFRARALLARDD